MKRILSLFLTLVLTAALLCPAALAVNETAGKDRDWVYITLDPGHGGDGGDNDRIDRCEFSRQPDARYGNFAELPDHDLIDHTERRLQRRGDRERAYGFKESALSFHNAPPVFPLYCNFREGERQRLSA